VSEALEFMYLNMEMGGIVPRWELFEWKGGAYATWNFTPRIFDGIYDIFTALLTVE